MICGIGIDILSLERTKGILEVSDKKFLNHIYSKKEREQSSLNSEPRLFLSTCFCAKEAVFKCLGSNGDRINFNEIQILQSDFGQPYVELLGYCSEFAKAKGIKTIHISISYETDYIIAFAVATAAEVPVRVVFQGLSESD
jgi:holo-[acyl-carrier protein] synthase